MPALERALSLVGADLHAWFAVLPRPQRLLPQKRPAAAVGLAAQQLGGPGAATAATIDSYYLSRHCAVRALSSPAARLVCWKHLHSRENEQASTSLVHLSLQRERPRLRGRCATG